MPCVGVLIAWSELSLPLTVFLSVVAGVLGSLVIYAVLLLGRRTGDGETVRQEQEIQVLVRKCHEFIDAQHGRGLAIIRVIPMYPHHCFHPGRTAPDAGQVVRRLVCGGHHGVEYRAHFVRVFLQREDSQHGNVTKYIDRVNPRICPAFCVFRSKMGASIL